MAWIRLNTGQDLVLNLEHYGRIEMCPVDGNASWAVQALTLEDRSAAPTTLFRGTKPECETMVDEIAKLVWAMDVRRPWTCILRSDRAVAGDGARDPAANAAAP